jgi:hypothetical protein
MLLTLVQRFLMSVSTLLPYYQTSISRHFNLREVRKSKIIQNNDFGHTKQRKGGSMVVTKKGQQQKASSRRHYKFGFIVTTNTIFYVVL